MRRLALFALLCGAFACGSEDNGSGDPAGTNPGTGPGGTGTNPPTNNPGTNPGTNPGDPPANPPAEDAGPSIPFPGVMDAGSSTNPPGTSGVGSACPCTGGLLCLQDETETYCSKNCTADTECPTNYYCAELQNGGGACAKNSGTTPPPPTGDGGTTPGGGAMGTSCAGGSRCATSLLCLNDSDRGEQYCTKRCSADADCRTTTDPNWECVQLQGGGGACSKTDPATPFDSGRDCARPAGTTGPYCSAILAFPNPATDDGYRVAHERKYSYLRRDNIMLVRYAAKAVLTKYPGTPALDMMDMSQADGNTPGADVGSLRHPASTHEDGNDIDIAYYHDSWVLGGRTIAENRGGEVCQNNGSFCTSNSTVLQAEKTAYFVAKLLESSLVRVIGFDTKLVQPIRDKALALYNAGQMTQTVYNKFQSKMASGSGWPFHHHHMHLSLNAGLQKPGFSDDGLGFEVQGCGFDLRGLPTPRLFFEIHSVAR